MEKYSKFCFHQHLDPSSPNLNLSVFPFDTANLNACPISMNLQSIEDSTPKTVSFFPVSGLQHYKTSEGNGPRNLLKCMSRFHQAFTPVLNFASNERFPSEPFDFGKQISPTMADAPVCKKFLVFDRSGDRTTMVCSSGFQTPVPSSVPNPLTTHNLSKKESRDGIYPWPISANENVDYNDLRDLKEDEMHESTEELNALLCSDSDSDFYVDDEEASTGHSPSTMTENGVPDWFEETGEEVDSFPAPAKRQKLLNGGYDTPPKSADLEEDSESKQCKEELHPWYGGKRSRKEKIYETLSILQSFIPNVNGEDAISVIDEAIQYLRSLKAIAGALGPDTL